MGAKVGRTYVNGRDCSRIEDEQFVSRKERALVFVKKRREMEAERGVGRVTSGAVGEGVRVIGRH